MAICRPFNTYGPRQSDRAIIPTLIAQALRRDEVEVGNTSPTRDFTFVTDTAEGFIAVAQSDACVGEEVNLGTGREISIGELIEKIVEVVGREVGVTQSEERMRPSGSEVERLCAANAKVRRLTGWSPEVSLEEGLRRTAEFVRARSHLYDPDTYRT